MRKIAFASLLALALTAAAGNGFSYVLSNGNGNTVIAGAIDMRFLRSIKSEWGDRFLWAKVDGRQYLIHDQGVLAEARAAFGPADALHAECEKLEARMRPVDERHEKLERQIDRIGDDLSDRDDLSHSERRQMEQRLDELERQIKPIAAELRQLEAEEERLDQREEKLVAVAEAKLRQIVERAIANGKAQRP